MKCDVLVVGASPAGVMAATFAAKAGSNVILIDKDLDSLSHAANTLFEGMALRAGLKIEDCYVQNTLDGMRILSPTCSAVTIPARGYFLDRKKFDDYYLHMAEDAGVMLLRGQAEDLKPTDGRRLVVTNQGNIEANVVIDASGVRPALAAPAGLSPMRHPEDIAWAIEATVEYPGIGKERFFEYWIGNIAPGWKATFSPAGGDLATLGIFVRGHGQNVQPFFRRFLSRFKQYKLKSYRNIEDLKILSVRGGGDPIATLPEEIVSDGFMITGGAAGQSGLAYSMRAGTICGIVAGQAVAEGDVSRAALAKYEKIWRSEFYWEYRMGRAALETLSGLKDDGINKLVEGLSGKNLIPAGSFYEKAFHAGIKVTLVQPKVALSLLLNMAKG